MSYPFVIIHGRYIVYKTFYLGLSIIEIGTIVMFEFWYDFVKTKYADLCYMHIDSFKAYIRTEDSYVDTAKDVETRFDSSNCELVRPLPKVKNKNK